MRDKIYFGSGLNSENAHIKKIESMFDELDKILQATSAKLQGDEWEGKSKKTCVEANVILKAYGEALKPYIRDLGRCYDKMDYNVNSFSNTSKNVKSIKGWR